MRINRLTLSVALTLAAVAGVACSDSPTATSTTQVRELAVSEALAVKPKPRTTHIADLQLSSIYVSMSGGFTPYTVTVANPTSKDIGNIYLKGELKSQNNQPPLPASAFLAYCPNPNGVIPRGQSCVMSDGITGGATLAPGPGTFTLYLQQLQPDGSMKVLDTKIVDVILRQF
jgi:hypothetical protein